MGEEIILPEETVINKIYVIRGLKVMLDKDLAELYGVTTGNLNKAVRRNIKRFPVDFMFQLTHEEFADLKLQMETSGRGGTRKMSKAFTEQGVAMLSGMDAAKWFSHKGPGSMVWSIQHYPLIGTPALAENRVISIILVLKYEVVSHNFLHVCEVKEKNLANSNC